MTASEIEKRYGVNARHAARDFASAITGTETRYGRECKLYSQEKVEEIVQKRKEARAKAIANYADRPNIMPGTHSRLKKVLDKALYQKLRNAWYGMMRRCYTKDRPGYAHYREQKVTVCKEWLESFDEFALWSLDHGVNMNLSLDRIDNDKGYSPDNCRWATSKTQNNNSSQNIFITYEGETHTIAEWADILGVKYNTLYVRLKSGWSVERAFTTKVRGSIPRLTE